MVIKTTEISLQSGIGSMRVLMPHSDFKLSIRVYRWPVQTKEGVWAWLYPHISF